MATLDTKSALTCLVPEVPQIQKLRAEYDTAYKRWAPHFNINCFPFLHPENHAEAGVAIQRVCAGFEPMDLCLDGVAVFPAKKKAPGTLYATVADRGGRLAELVTEVARATGMPEKAFAPHVTLGRFTSQDEMEAVRAEVAAGWEPLQFKLLGLHLITRGPDTPFKEKAFYAFGEEVQESGEAHVDPVDMAIEQELSKEFTATKTQLSGYCAFRVRREETRETAQGAREKVKVMNILVVDNSGSMGSMTADATRTIGKGMFDLPAEKVEMLPGAVIAFAEAAQVLSSTVTGPEDILKLRFPRQGRTNITAGITLAIDIVLANREPDTHHIITFLSDGHHNCGPQLGAGELEAMRAKLAARSSKLSFIVVGISSPDTSLGMRIKTGLETVHMQTMESVYYAKSKGDMEGVLTQLTEGCVMGLSQGIAADATVEGGVFFENSARELRVFVDSAELLVLVQGRDPVLRINGAVVGTTAKEPEPSDVKAVVDSVAPKLSQMKIANGTESITGLISYLEKLIDDCVAMFASRGRDSDNGQPDQQQSKTTPAQRLKMLHKKTRQTTTAFQESRNKLKHLLAKVSDNSSEQAAYLTGINKKYASKAVVRAGMDQLTVKDVVDQLKKVLPELVEAMKKDEALSAAGSEEQEAPQSILSLNTAREQLAEWAGDPSLADSANFDDIYSILVCFGYPGYPVAFEHTAAAQMDPFQTRCTYIEPCMVDTPSLMLANQTQQRVVSHSRKPMTDALVLIDPSCPNAGLVLRRCLINQFLCSVTLCRDLFMYNPRMQFSMHAHALVECVGKYCGTGSSAYLGLAVRIVYSMRKIWGQGCKSGDNVELFKRWAVEWAGLTQSESDQCNSPVMVVLLMCALDFGEIGVSHSAFESTQPFVTMVNEVLARVMKMKLKGHCIKVQNAKAKQPPGTQVSEDDTKQLAVKLLCNFFNITKQNSPKPLEDPMSQEPTMISVRESCQHWVDTDEDQDPRAAEALEEVFGVSAGITAFVSETLGPISFAYRFGLGMQEYLKRSSEGIEPGAVAWDTAITEKMERLGGVPEDLVEFLAEEMRGVREGSVAVFDLMGVGPGKADEVARCMFAQAVLCHDSASRAGVGEASVTDPETFQELIKDLRMSHYFAACKVKREVWLSMIGDVTYEKAMNADESAFSQMIGVHTHGHPKAMFWAMVRSAKLNGEKRKMFISKSNDTVARCFERV